MIAVGGALSSLRGQSALQMNMIITFVLSCLLAGMTYIVLGYFLTSAAAGTAAVVISIVFAIVLSHSFILSKR